MPGAIELSNILLSTARRWKGRWMNWMGWERSKNTTGLHRCQQWALAISPTPSLAVRLTDGSAASNNPAGSTNTHTYVLYAQALAHIATRSVSPSGVNQLSNHSIIHASILCSNTYSTLTLSIRRVSGYVFCTNALPYHHECYK